MAKNKKRGGGPKFKGRQFPHRKDDSSGNHFGEYSGNTSSLAPQGFIRAHRYTLADEARNTASNRRGAFGRDARLRYKPVTFISAGLMNPLEDLDVRLASTDKAQGKAGDANELPDIDIVSVPADEDSPHDHQPTDRTGPSSNPDCGHSSDSSEDVVLFKGRDRTRSCRDDVNGDTLKLRELDIELQAVEKTFHENTAPADSVKKALAKTDGFISLGSTRPRGRNRGNGKGQRTSSDDAAAVVADYMANIRSWAGEKNDEDVEHSGLGSHSFSVLRDLGGTDSDAIPDEAPSKDNTDCVSEDGTDAASQVHGCETEDERVARLLTTQEELGFGSDDILLFDGDASTHEWLATTKTSSRRRRKGDSKSAKIFQKKDQYPSATQMADAFDELDLMDWHRPSLTNFKESPQTLDLSDSELEEAMKTTWQKDRLKKAEKKKAREELRSRGLLGKKKANPDDLRVKYLGGMSLDDLANELETFLLSSQEQLILPPFDKGTRKTIHIIANRFRIKSQSAGKGQDRCPVLYRSKATLPFDQDTFDRTFGRIKQTWFPRIDADETIVNESRLLKRSEARNGKSRFKNSLTYRDGDIVGQHAAELGAENRGRAMLEKMGWSKGMALGTGENQGIMVPITHVVKKTKAGLGDN
ncbi:hypothetical protein F5B19DRAFT_474416 [Rostrohypoxylon terebratum]|nr:hypothetical protein F5B19DRAFT_474416 [Rostrohypoxylon terebratum]